MVLEKDNFILEFDESNDYIYSLVDYLEFRISDILAFFGLSNLKNKKRIIIYNDVELYKKHIEKYYKYEDYMCADTNDGNINLLSLDEAHKTLEHKDMTIDDLKSVIVHEFVHIAQQDSQLETLDKDVDWFWEALATNIGNPEDFFEVVIEATNEEIGDFNKLPNNYPIAYTIGRYLIDNYSKEEILEYVRYPKKLLSESDRILNEARKWSKSFVNKK